MSFDFTPDALGQAGERLAASYDAAAPFPHIVIDDFLDADQARRAMAAFPKPGDAIWHTYQKAGCALKQEATELSRYPRCLQEIVLRLQSSAFVTFLEKLSGIAGLIPDPHLGHGGLNQVGAGGHLAVHADYNYYERLRVYRRLNLLLYFNEDWAPEYGGNLELWEPDMSRCRVSVTPLLNRCAIFSVSDRALHGYPDPLSPPPGHTRKSLGLYYYAVDPPAAQLGEAPHRTLWYPRPAANAARPASPAAAHARQARG